MPWLQPPGPGTLVSVVTPTTGRPEIKGAIESVVRQTYGNIEHIIVADGPVAADRCPVQPSAVLGRCWSTPRTGPGGYATNVGWLLAHGEYIYTLPDDDWLEPNAIKTYIEHIDSYDFAWSMVEFSTPDLGMHCFSRPVSKWISGSQDDINGNHATPDQFFHRRLLEFGMYFASGTWEPGKPGHDIDLLDKWREAGASGIFIPQVLHHHRVDH